MEVTKRPPPTSFSHAASLKIGLNPQNVLTVKFKGAFSGLRQFLATEISFNLFHLKSFLRSQDL